MNYWINKERDYKSDVGMQSIYMMFLTSLNIAYLSDEASDNLTQNSNLKWSRINNTVILGAMNWKDTYQHILTPDMGRQITGDDESDIIKFRFVKSPPAVFLPDVRQAAHVEDARFSVWHIMSS